LTQRRGNVASQKIEIKVESIMANLPSLFAASIAQSELHTKVQSLNPKFEQMDTRMRECGTAQCE